MILYPAIDLKDGACVRLRQGDMARATVFNTDPASQARSFESAGFSWIHVVDLDGAVSGTSVNAVAIADVIGATRLRIQLGGGIRDLSRVEYWLANGVERVILGTIALRDSAMVREACRRFPAQIAVAIDARDGRVAVEGWAETSEVRTLDLALRFEDAGVSAIIFTDINRDGVMAGVNLEATVDLAFALQTPVIASGGVASLADLRDLKARESAGIAGVICGRALYDGRIRPEEALSIVGRQAD